MMWVMAPPIPGYLTWPDRSYTCQVTCGPKGANQLVSGTQGTAPVSGVGTTSSTLYDIAIPSLSRSFKLRRTANEELTQSLKAVYLDQQMLDQRECAE